MVDEKVTEEQYVKNALQQISCVSKRLQELHNEFLKFAQSKSNFQIEKFSVAAEGTTYSHQYRHGLKQIEVGLYQVKLWLLEAERLNRKIKRCKEETNQPDSESEDHDLSILEAETELDRLELSIVGRMREIATYDKICTYINEQYGPFTAEQYQADEVEYYAQRLARQAIAQRQSIGSGNFLSIINAQAPAILPDSNNQFILPPNQEMLALIAQQGLDAVLKHLKVVNFSEEELKKLQQPKT